MKNKFLSILTLALTTMGLNAQVNSYSFTQFQGNYGATNSGTVIGNLLQDDEINLVNLPFTFTFNNTPYNAVNVSSNGFISFTPPSASEYFPVSGNTQNAIAAYGQDLYMGTVIQGSVTAGSNIITNLSSTLGLQVGDSLLGLNFEFNAVNPIITAINGNSVTVNINAVNDGSILDIFLSNGRLLFNVYGAAPNRVCEFTFLNFTRFSIYDENMNFKIRLYENSNKIETVYGMMVSGQNPVEGEVGLKGMSAADFNSRKVYSINTWSTSNAATLITDNCDFSAGKFPNNGLTYQWDKITCSQPTLSVTKSNSVICVGQSATLTANGATSYTWSGGSTSNSIVINPTVTTTYTLTGSNANCTSSITVQQVVNLCTSVEEVKASVLTAKVYPIPFNDELNIENSQEITISYSIIDLTGKILIHGTLEPGVSARLSTGDLQSGLYIIQLKSKTETKSTKLIKK